MKNKLMGLFALASCVMLAGCGENPGPGPDPDHQHSFSTEWKSDDSKHWHECSCGEKADEADHVDEDNNGKCDACEHSVPKKEPLIEIKDLPTDLVNGDEIDLANYITVKYGKTSSYSINFDDESFSMITQLTDTKIRVDQSGTIKFTVDYSGKSQEASLVVGSKMVKDFVTAVKNAGYDYAEIYQDDYDDYHWENYGEKFIIDSFYTDEPAYGYLEAPDEKVYSYELDDEGNFTFSITGNEPEFISDYSKPLDLPLSGYEVCVEGTGSKAFEYLRLDENDEGIVRNIILNFYNISEESLDAVLTEYNLSISSFQVIPDVLEIEEGVEMPIYDTYAFVIDNDPESQYFGEELWLSNTWLSFDSDFFFRDEVQAYIDSGEQPRSAFALDVEDIAIAINKHNYTITYDYGWYDCSVSPDGMSLIRGEKRDDNPFVDGSTTGYYIHDYYNAIGSFNVYVGEDKTFSDVPHENGYGLINHDVGEGVYEGYEYNGNSIEGYKASKESTGFDLFDSENDFLYYNYQFLTGAEIEEWPSVYESLFINNMVDNGDGSFTFELGGASAFDLFDCLFLESVNDGAYPQAEEGENPSFALFNSLNIVAEFILEQGMDIYFDLEITEKYSGEDLVGLTFDFFCFDASEDYSEYYQYVLSADIDFTQCDMPVFDVNFPVAA